jgi:hypothetical protein
METPKAVPNSDAKMYWLVFLAVMSGSGRGWARVVVSGGSRDADIQRQQSHHLQQLLQEGSS